MDKYLDKLFKGMKPGNVREKKPVSNEEVGRLMTDMLNKQNANCKLDSTITFGGDRILNLDCALKRYTLRMEWYPNTGHITDFIKLY